MVNFANMNIRNESKVKSFSTQVLERFQHSAIESGLISIDILKRLSTLNELADLYKYKPNRTVGTLEQAVEQMNGFSDEEKKQIAKYFAIRFMVLNGLQGYEDALTLPSPKDRFKEYYRSMFKELQEKGYNRADSIEILKKVKNKVLIKLTYTVHPTVFLSIDSINFQRELTHEMEEIAGYLVQDGRVEVTQDSLNLVSHKIDSFIDDVINNKAKIAHLEQVTVEEERKVASENTKYLKTYQRQDAEAHDEALGELLEEEDLELTKSETDELKFNGRIPYENHTWIDADADGREKTDSISTARAIIAALDEDKILDLRQNAEIFQNLASGLVQVKFRENREFAAFCRHFVDDVNASSVKGWLNPRESIYQELGEHKSEFLRRVIKSDFNLVPREVVAHAVPFTSQYIRLFDDFVARERANNPDIPVDVTFSDLKKYADNEHEDPLLNHKNLQLKLKQLVKDTPVEFELNGKKLKWKFRIGESGHHYVQDDFFGSPEFFRKTFKLDPTDPKKNPDDIRYDPDAPWDKMYMSNAERDVMMDQLRKFEIMRDAKQRYGKDKVCYVHEIANFSSAENFYELMLLFKDTGLIKVHDGLITDVDIQIVPLLETEEDLLNAEKIFKELLEDPLARSYYEVVMKQFGSILIMEGFSDGAKSAGNFASQSNAIPASKARIAKMFEKYGFKVEFKDGRGSTTERGGMPEAGTSVAENPDEANLEPIEYRTIQSNQPNEWASSQTRGRDQLASMVIGRMMASIAAITRTPEERAFRELCDEAIDFIARVSASQFRIDIRDNKETMGFLKGIPYNAKASSRAAQRSADATAKSGFSAVRAVPVSQKSNLSHIPFNDVGTREAFEHFMAGHPVTIVENGEEVTINSQNILERLSEHFDKRPEARLTTGELALEVLKKHPKFENFLMKTEVALQQNFDPNFAELYGRKTKREAFVQKVSNSLNGLRDICQKTLRRVGGYNRHSEKTSIVADQKHVSKFIADILVFTLPTDAKIDKPQERSAAEALYTGLCVSAYNDMEPKASVRGKDLAGLLFGRS